MFDNYFDIFPGIRYRQTASGWMWGVAVDDGPF